MDYLIEWLQNWGLRETLGLIAGVAFLGGSAIIERGTHAANVRLDEQFRRPRR